MKTILSLFIVLAAFLTDPLTASDRELVVVLETGSKLSPVSVEPFVNNRSGFSRDYLKELENVLRFDFSNNGKTVLAESTKALHRISVSVKEYKLKAVVTSPYEEEELQMNEICLTGYPQEDRRLVHKLSDAILRELFEVEGIASTRLLYTVKKKEGGKDVSEVWECDYDGGNGRRLIQNSGYCVTPAYIPPKPGYIAGSFVYVSYKTGIPKIYVASTEGEVGRQLISLSGNQLMPAVSRLRDRIAYISDVTGSPDLFIQDFDPEKGIQGKPRHLYTAPNATQASPAFSPEGTRIAFVSDKGGGSPAIYVLTIPPQGTPLKTMTPTLITKSNRENTAPCWSPDGTKIAYCAKTNGVRQIWVYDFLTGKERQLTDGAGNKENPTWAPNSMHLVFNTSDSLASELYLINLNQPQAVRISSGTGEKRFPHWQPR